MKPFTPSTLSDPVTVKGRVERIFYTSPDFTAGLLVPESGSVVTGGSENGGKAISFAGPLAVSVNDQIILHGEWSEHERFGTQLKVKRFSHDQALDRRGLAHYLASHPDFRGVGPVKAKKLAEAFGENFGATLEAHPEKIAEVGNIPLVSVENLRAAWISKSEQNASMAFLASLDLTHYQQKALAARFGSSVATVLKRDPYVIAEKVRGFGFKRADEIARKVGVALDSPARLSAAVLHTLDERRERGGDCFVEREDLITTAQKLLAVDGSTMSVERVAQTIDALVESERAVAVKFEDSERDERIGIGLRGAFECEVFLRDFFRRAADRSPRNVLECRDGDPGSILQGAQCEALEAARDSGGALLITGGAGSGKTFTIASIVGMYTGAGLVVALAAPTGKAARRIEEVARHEALTIHRLLEYGQGGGGGGGFARTAKNPIDADVVIIDEVSMLDVELARALFSAIDLGRTALVLVGDPNQLPPVGPGNLLRDIIARRLVPIVRLDVIIRQAGVLREHSAGILRSVVAPTVREPVVGSGVYPWTVARSERYRGASVAQAYILKLFAEKLEEKLGFDLLRDVQVLTPTHKGALGTLYLNVSLQRLVQHKLWGVTVAAQVEGRRPRLYLHDRVIQTKNDYSSEVMNGTVGRVVECSGDGRRISVDFGDERDSGSVPYDSATLGDLQLAYALTVHKAQGSEFPCVILVVHSDHAYQHHRNLFYTGVTRAQQSVIIVGDPEGIARCVARGEVERRKTFLSVL